MRGQCYDGSSNMSGARSGCSTLIRQQSPMAVYFHCAAHRLNLAVVSACKIQAFRNVESYIGEIARFFAFSAKRQRLFDRVVDTTLPKAKAQKLKDACQTRWIQRIDSYTVFWSCYQHFTPPFKLWWLRDSMQSSVIPGVGMVTQ